MFRVLQNRANNSKSIFFGKDLTCIPFLNSSRFSIFLPQLQKQRVFTRHKFSAFLAPIERVESGQIYYDNYDNLRITTPVRWPIDFRRFIPGPSEEKIMNKLKTGQWIPAEDEMPYKFKIEGVKIRKKEDGMFVNFTFQVDPAQKEKALQEIIDQVQTFLERKRDAIFFDMKAYLVKGEPFIEDLVDRYPASRLRVEFQGSNVLIETLYKYLEQYGQIRDMKLYPASSKDFLPYALVQYSKVRSAVCAKNCVHGMIVNGSRLNIMYNTPIKMFRFYRWVMNHPTLSTISIPLIPFFAVLVISGIAYGFDLACNLLIRTRITHYYSYQRLREKATNLFAHFREMPKEESFDFSTKEQEDKLRNWLEDSPESFIVLIGPTSSGKSTLINKIVQGKRSKVYIKCDDILGFRGKGERALELARQVGCSPVFSFVISLSNVGNLLANDIIGHKIFGLPSTIDDPIKKILDMLEDALAKRTHHIQKVSDVIEDYSEEYPVIVIDAYMIKYKENHELWENLIKFATKLVKKKLAHVIFVSSNGGITDHLKVQVPSMEINQLDLHDPNEVISLVEQYARKNNIEIPEGLKEAIGNIGLHLTDLGLFFRKIHTGSKPDVALDNLIKEAKIEIYNIAFNDDEGLSKDRKWSDIQFWEIMKGLSKKKFLFYDIVKSSTIFNDDDIPIKAMEHAGLITITQLQNESSVALIKPGKLLYQKVFEEISSDKLFETKMKYKTAQYHLLLENNKIKEYENELEKLVKIDRNWNDKPVYWWWFGNGRESIDHRIKFLLSQLKRSLARAKKYQKQIDELKQTYESTLNEKEVK